MPGVFLCLEGVDHSGKTTQIALLADRLRQNGFEPVLCRDPGGTAIGDRIREILLDTRAEMAMNTEALLYMSSRAQLIAEIIRPALAAGQLVLSDRFLLSTIVYQGHAGGLDPEAIRQAGGLAAGGILPDWIGVLDLDSKHAAMRREGLADRIESRPLAYHRAVREGFLAEARRAPEQISIIDANAEAVVVADRVWSQASGALRRAGIV